MQPCTGNTFASLSRVIDRCRRLTERVHLNEDGWRQNKQDQFFWRFVIPVLVERVDVSDEELARAMLLDARRTIDERLAALEPKDGVERIIVSVPSGQCCMSIGQDGVPIVRSMTASEAASLKPALDLRTKEGRAWKRVQAAGGIPA